MPSNLYKAQLNKTDMNHMKAIQPIIQMDQKEHLDDIGSHEAEDIGSHEAKLKLDGPYLNHQGNVTNDEVNVFYDDLKLPKGSITISHGKKFKEISRAKLKEALQGCMKNIWANHAHEDSIHFKGFCGSEIEAKWALFNILAVHVFDDYG